MLTGAKAPDILDTSTRGAKKMLRWIRIQIGWWKLEREMEKLNKICEEARERAR